jgi:hypothetical protein
MTDITSDRRKFHRPIDSFDVETCQHCGKPLDSVIDEINGLELVCNNPDCPRRYNHGL